MCLVCREDGWFDLDCVWDVDFGDFLNRVHVVHEYRHSGFCDCVLSWFCAASCHVYDNVLCCYRIDRGFVSSLRLDYLIGSGVYVVLLAMYLWMVLLCLAVSFCGLVLALFVFLWVWL